MALNELIDQSIRATGRSQADVARALGMSQQALSDRLTGRTRWQLDDVVAIAAELAIDLGDLFDAIRDAASAGVPTTPPALAASTGDAP